MKKKRRNELYGLIAQVVSENPKLASGSLTRLVPPSGLCVSKRNPKIPLAIPSDGYRVRT